ncbi:uncharacterized protein [Dysidea avara]|uniref:uncharacterized protein n=1 Tax=Dysidea avara TaxID=196820 RepID=UPI00331F802D
MEKRYLSCFSILFIAPVVVILLYGAGYTKVYSSFLTRPLGDNGFGILASKSQPLLTDKDIFSSEEDLSEELSTGATHRKGYVLGWHYYEGQTCAARNMLGLQYWAASIGFAVVEPFVSNSFFATGPFISKGESLRFSDYFDINNWNHHVTMTGFAKPLVSWEEFIEKAPRKLIVVCVTMNSPSRVTTVTQINTTRVLQRGFTDETLSPFGFTVVRAMQFSFFVGSQLEMDEFNDKIFGNYNPNDVTVVFPFVPGVSRARINVRTKGLPDFRPWLQPSKRVIKDSKKYVETYLEGKQYVGVHIRTVKLAIGLKNKTPEDSSPPEFVENYLRKCSEIIGDLLLKIPGKHFLAVDIGTFGDPKQSSHMSRTQLQQTLSNLVNTVYDAKWDENEWETSFINITGGITDKGYIASLQKLLVSNASYLITAGGGSFQNSLKANHEMMTTEKDTIFSVCRYDEIKELLYS